MKLSKIFVALILGLAATGCENEMKMDMPANFVELNTEFTPYELRSVDADRIVVACRKEMNLKKATPAFWESMVREALEAKGYKFEKDSEIRNSENKQGKLLEFKFRTKAHTYKYFVAIFTTEKYVLIGEAGGFEMKMQAKRDEILNSFRSLRYGN